MGGPHRGTTHRLAGRVAPMDRLIPIRHVVEHLRMRWITAREIDKRCLHAALGAPEL